LSGGHSSRYWCRFCSGSELPDRLELLAGFYHQIVLRERQGGHRQQTADGQQ
jgi:hypothetical protein